MQQTREGDPLAAGALTPSPAQTTTLTTHQPAECAREVAMVRTAFELAVMKPRDTGEAGRALMEACQSPRFAERCEYRFPRSGGDVTGASVELAREAARCWGHILFGYQIIDDDDERVHLQAWAWDVQTGARDHAEARFKKKIQRKRSGQTVWITPDERDLDELIARRAAKLVRNCLLHVMPSDLIDAAIEQARATMSGEARASSGVDDRADFIAKIMRSVDALGLTRAQIERWLGSPLEEITDEQVPDLKGVLASIRDGNSKPAEHFGVEAAESASKPSGTEEAQPGGESAKASHPRKLADLTPASAEPGADPMNGPVVDDPFGIADEPWPAT